MNVDGGHMTAKALRELELTPVACCTAVTAPDITHDQARSLAAIFKALADPHRLRIVNLLANAADPVCVCDFMPELGLCPGDGELPPQEAARHRSPGPRAARHVGVLLAAARRAGPTLQTSSRSRRPCNDERHRASRRRATAVRRRGDGGHHRRRCGLRLLSPGVDLRRGGSRVRARAVRGARGRATARGGGARQPGLRESHRGGRARDGRDRPRPRIGRRHRRPAVGEARRAQPARSTAST